MTPRELVAFAEQSGIGVKHVKVGAYEFYGPKGDRLVAVDRKLGMWSYEGRLRDGTFYLHDMQHHGWPDNEELLLQLLDWLQHEAPRPRALRDNPEIPRCRRAFERLKGIVQEAFPEFDAALFVAKPEMFRDARSRAYCVDETPPRIGINPLLERESEERITGVMAHEIGGHALLFHLGIVRHTEREADKMAERVFRTKIVYDPELFIQQVGGHGIRPRPTWLG